MNKKKSAHFIYFFSVFKYTISSTQGADCHCGLFDDELHMPWYSRQMLGCKISNRILAKKFSCFGFIKHSEQNMYMTSNWVAMDSHICSVCINF